jgi:hypothetical protein
MTQILTKTNELFLVIQQELAEFEPFLYSTSSDGISFYIHFRNLPNECTHKLRISNHNERHRYGYKWQLRWDGLNDVDWKPYSRYFDDVNLLISNFKAYYKTVQKGELK